MSATFGYDISEHQRNAPNIARARFGICRSTYGKYIDAAVHHHARTVRRQGSALGLYAFGVQIDFRTGKFVPGVAQAEVLLRVADELAIDRIELDWEDDGPKRPQMPEDEARAFIEKVVAVHGDCGLYASASQFRDLGQTWDHVAKWGSAKPGWAGWEVWQNAANYRGQNLDTDYFNGDEETCRRFFAARGTGAPKPTPRPVAPPPQGEDQMFNVGPSTTERDARLKPGTVLYSDSALKHRVSRTEEGDDLGFAGSGARFYAVVNGGRVQYVDRDQVTTTTIPNVRHYT